MPVPVVFQDFFQRANGAPGVSWTLYGTNSWAVSGNALAVTPAGGDRSFAAVNAKMPQDGRSQAAEGLLGTGQWGVFVRGTPNYDTGADNYYSAEVSLSNPNAVVQLFKTVAGVKTQIGTNMAVTRAAGSILALDAVGSNLQVWYGNTLLQTNTDTTFTAGGVKSCGVVAVSGLTTLSRVDARADENLTLIPQKFMITPEFNSEVVEYDSGFVQRNLIWVRPRRQMKIGYDVLQDADKVTMWNFFMRKRAGFQPFLVQDPSWVINPIVQEVFAVADGVSTVYKVDVDKANSITTFTDGVQDSVQPVVSFALGIVIYATAPYGGAVLAYSAPYTANVSPFYRCYFKNNTLDFDRHVPNYWSVNFEAWQEKTLVEGIVQ